MQNIINTKYLIDAIVSKDSLIQDFNFNSPIFKDGTWYNGTWLNGSFHGLWLNGIWKHGLFFPNKGRWINGNWSKGHILIPKGNSIFSYYSTISPKASLRPKPTMALNQTKYI